MKRITAKFYTAILFIFHISGSVITNVLILTLFRISVVGIRLQL